MRSSKNELIIHRGESFTIDFSIVNADGSPFIFPKLEGGELILTIVDNKYSPDAKFTRRYRLDVPYGFEITNVIRLEDIKDASGNQKYKSFPDLPSDANSYLEGYYNGVLYTFEYGDVVFSLGSGKDVLYKYATDGSWEEYSPRFVITFVPEDTSEWPTQKLYYTVALVDSTGGYNVPIVGDASIDVLPSV